MRENYNRIEIEVPLAMMGDLDERVYFKTYWSSEEIEELGEDKICEPAIGSFSGANCIYRKGDLI